jgi:hypothetical protein
MNKVVLFFLIHFSILNSRAEPFTAAGFTMADSLVEVSLRYESVDNLILLPVTINDTIHVNLILDTGCRNLVLFGKRFAKLFDLHPEKRIQFSGLGAGRPVEGNLALENKVSIDAVLGNKIPVVVVPNQNLFGSLTNVDGVIGYDIFIKFEVELIPAQHQITFRPAFTAELSSDYEKVPIRVTNSLPVITSTIFLGGKIGQTFDLIIDTGSSLGLLVQTSDLEKYPNITRRSVIGRGFNGKITGASIDADRLFLHHLEIRSIAASLIYSEFYNHASVGMEIMKDFAVVLNYCKAYAGFKRIF